MSFVSTSIVEISQNALRKNLSAFKRLLHSQDKIIAVIKANAYGHGIKEVIATIEKDVSGFQVDDIEEFLEARKYTQKDIFVFGYINESNLEIIVKNNGSVGCYNLSTLRKLDQLSRLYKKKIKIHLKIDAFLGRQGVFLEDVLPFLNIIKKSEFLQLEAVYSHFSNIEDVQNLSHAEKQYLYLQKVCDMVKEYGFSSVSFHIAATSGILTNGSWGGAYVRLGIGLYGLWPSESLYKKNIKKIKLYPVLKWITEVAQLKSVPKNFPIGYGLSYITNKQTRIAVIPQGYSDGYDRGLSQKGAVLIHKKICPVLGRVAMNMFVVDVSKVPFVSVGDKVVLLGSDHKTISPDYMAHCCGTINYEIVARISPLIKRIIRK